MGTRFRKSVHAGPFRATISKSGVSASVGVKGYRVTKNSSGQTRTTGSIPGSGLSYVSESNSKRTSSGADSGDYVYAQKVASSTEEETLSTSQTADSSLPPKEPLIDRIFKPVMIICAILIALSGGILFFIGREPASQDPAEQISTEQNDTPYPQLTDQQLQPFANASAALVTDGNYTVKANATLGFIEITWWSPSWTETIASSENTAPDKWSDLTSAAAELTSEMQSTTENLGYARTVFQIVDDSNASTIYATCQGGKVLYDIFSKTEAEESQANDPIVYVSESGSRYHKDPTCGGHTLHPLLRSLALKNGLSPCKKCVM